MMEPSLATNMDDPFITRIVTLREQVRDHKQRAIDLWNACCPANQEISPRPSVGKFTRQLAHSE